MPAAKFITPGERFGRWTALENTETRTYPSHRGKTKLHECRCDCGTVQFVANTKLRSGWSKSCGCLQAEITADRSLKHGYATRNREDGVYNVWCSMRARCNNPNNKAHVNYGGRGIKVCERWLNSFENFVEDMGEPPNGASIDRIDNDGNYCKENCAWRTPRQQARNRRNTIILTFNGITLSLPEWAEMLELRYSMLRARHAYGWTTERILTVPKNNLK